MGEGNGNPLQYSCLENPRDGGAQWAAVYGVAQSWTRLERLSSSIHVSELLSDCPLLFPCCAPNSVLYDCASVPALQIGPSVPFYMHVLIYNIYFSLFDLLHSV